MFIRCFNHEIDFIIILNVSYLKKHIHNDYNKIKIHLNTN